MLTLIFILPFGTPKDVSPMGYFKLIYKGMFVYLCSNDSHGPKIPAFNQPQTLLQIYFSSLFYLAFQALRDTKPLTTSAFYAA